MLLAIPSIFPIQLDYLFARHLISWMMTTSVKNSENVGKNKKLLLTQIKGASILILVPQARLNFLIEILLMKKGISSEK